PDCISLYYRLSMMKAKDASIAIESDEEMVMFISRMHTIIIPPCCCDGKQSTHPPKDVEVCFEDTSVDNGSSLCAPLGSSKQASSEVPAEHPSLLNGTALWEKYVSQLQRCWRCIVHTKSPQNPVWCYCDPIWGNSSSCQKLTYANLSFWALEIVSFIFSVLLNC
ncbi:hypothetical protein PAXRUDRAFT_171957, partial [Paxillus rubicundulus Ve08.2h10]